MPIAAAEGHGLPPTDGILVQEAAVEQASAAVGGGRKAAVCRLEVGLDTKALAEAWGACQKAHPQLPVMFISTDTGVLTTSLCMHAQRYTHFTSRIIAVWT